MAAPSKLVNIKIIGTLYDSQLLKAALRAYIPKAKEDRDSINSLIQLIEAAEAAVDGE